MSGELSPLLWCQPDMPAYGFGARTLENFMVVGPGKLTRAPGTRFIALGGANDAGENTARFVRFVYSEADAYILEFGPSYIHFYRSNKTKVVDGGGVTVEVATTYTADEVFELQFYQSADVMYITHPAHFPAKLTRSSHTSWALADCGIDDGPFLAENTDGTNTITPSGTTGSITLTAVSATFVAGHTDSFWAIRHVMPSASKNGTFSGTGDSDSLFLPKDGAWQLSLTDVSGSCVATIQVQFSADNGGTWTKTAEYTNSGTVNIDRTPTGDNLTGQNVLVRVSCTSYVSGSITYELQVPPYIHQGVVQIDLVNGDTSADATVVTDLGSTDASHKWAEGAWSAVRGFPRAVSFNGERILYGGTSHQPLTIWGSVVGEYENFLTGTTDADAWTYTLSRSQQNPIQWLCGDQTDAIIVGTLGGILQLLPISAGAFTYSNPPKVYSSAAEPAAAELPALMSNVLLFIDKTGKKVHQVGYNDQEASIVAQDLTFNADHITGTGISQLCVQNTISPILWSVREDGQLAGLSFNRMAQVVAWHRYATGGDIVSAATIPASGSQHDQLWLYVKRTVNGLDYYMTEVMEDLDLDVEPKDGLFLHSEIAWDGGGAIDLSAITAANPGVLTLASWPVSSDGADLADDDNVRVRGYTDLEDQVFVVDNANKGALTLTLKALDGTAIDTSAMTAYVSGGTLEWVENTFTGITHLASTTADVLADGIVDTVAIDGSGAAVLDDYASVVRIGLTYTCTYKGLPLELFGEQVSIGRPKRLTNVGLVLYNSLGGQYGVDLDSMKDIPYSSTGAVGYYPAAVTQAKILEGPGGYSVKDLFLYVQQDDPFPMTICAIVPTLEVS